jgi:ABC-type dipeptide/oligopeptide/nickel transport system permease subunit
MPGYAGILASPREVLVPTVAIAWATLGFSFLADALRDIAGREPGRM